MGALCVDRLLCVSKLCVWVLEEEAGGEHEADGSVQPKTGTAHKDAGNNIATTPAMLWTSFKKHLPAAKKQHLRQARKDSAC